MTSVLSLGAPPANTAAMIRGAFGEVDREWTWRENGGNCLRPKVMRTHHLFCTLRMIWNNTVEPQHHVGRVRLYAFGPAYTPRYMQEAVKRVGAELARRDDLEPWMLEELRQMAEHLKAGVLSAPLLTLPPRG